MKIYVKRAEAAQGRLAKHASAGNEIRETAASVASLHGLPDANPAQMFASHLKDLAERMKTILETAVKNATAADNSPVFANDLKNLRGALGWTPPIAYSTRTVSVAFDERVPDLEPGQYYTNDGQHDEKDGDREKELWGADGDPSVDDVNQGDFGDCWLLAVLNSMVATRPNKVRALITDHGDGTYTVHLAAGDVLVSDSALPNTNASNQKWVRLIEYAYAQHEGSYKNIDGGYGANAMKVVFGLDNDHYDPEEKADNRWPWDNEKDPQSTFDSMASALANGLPVTVSVRNKEYGLGSHELAIIGFVWIDGVRYAKVRNPWGSWPDGTKADWKTKLDAKGSEEEPGVSNPDPGTLLVPAKGLAKACSRGTEGK